jgi:ribonuclease BN (tRNA processing enzyme)
MELSLLGTANPCPQPERAGISTALSIGGDTVLVDCGPWASYRLFEAGIDVTAIEDLFFTHHHMDHNVSFFHFVLASWYLGRDSLAVYGPESGTRDLIEGYRRAFRTHFDDVEGWRDGPKTGLTDPEVRPVDPSFREERSGWTVSALPTAHSVETYAYRFDEAATGASFVYTGDTPKDPAIAEFASDADVLVHDCNRNGETEDPLDWTAVDDRYADAPYRDYLEWVFADETQAAIADMHTTPAGAGEVAAEAGVETLVLTHLNPLRDVDAIRAEAASTFDGTVLVGSDGQTLSPGA